MMFPIKTLFARRVATAAAVPPGDDSEKASVEVAAAGDEHEARVCARLARFAQVPVSAMFEVEPGWSSDGLTEAAAAAALKQHGPNIPVTERPLAGLLMLWTACVNPFNILLTTLACVSIGTKDVATFSVMMAMVVLSTGIRYWQEIKSMTQAIRLIKSVSTRVRVVRARAGGVSAEAEIDQKDVVPGDVLAVASGDVFPGDCVLIAASALTVAQAALTGELMPVDKAVRRVPAPAPAALALLDNDNVCLAGTSVATGSGRALVVATGSHTYMAGIAKHLEKRRPPNATQIGIRKVSYVLLGFLTVMAPLVFVVQGSVSRNWRGAVTFAIAVAVGLTPEMLPMIVTSNLALSAVRVSRQKVIVKRFDAIQNLGAVSILCSDKTGTLTVDLVRISTSTSGTGAPTPLPVRLAFLNSLLQTGTRSPIDRAVVDYVADLAPDAPDGADWTKHGEVPFDSARRLLSVLVAPPRTDPTDGLLVTKGAVDELLDRCVDVYDHPAAASPAPPVALADFRPAPASPLTPDLRRRILDTAERLNADGLRLVAVACRTMLVKPFMSLSPTDEDDLVFVGFLGFLDPLKPDAAEAVRNLAALSVQVRILTGDAPAVAAKVARDLGILPSTGASPAPPSTPASASVSAIPLPADLESKAASASPDHKDLIITGAQLAALKAGPDKAAYTDAIERCIVFAKLSPYQKLEVVEKLRAGGGSGPRAVAFLGDGVNDALAIRGADVGISVDSGMEIAKEAADVILLEKSLGVVANGVLQGRMTFVNTMKYIKMATSSNFGNVFSVLVASAWLPYQPMLPLQLLTQNLLYDFSQGSIPWDNIDPECLEKPRTWKAKSIFTFMICMGPFSSPFDITTFCINWFHYGIRTADSPLVRRAQTNWFLEGSLTQLFIIHFLRTGRVPFIGSRASLPVVAVTFLVAGIAMAIPYIPAVSGALQMMPPEREYYGFLAATITGYACVIQVVKTLYQAKFKEWL